jgi:drug/metabolite transporter (DMT)-like permease
MPVLALVLSAGAAVLFAVGYVLQYHEAHEAPQRLFLSPRLLLELVRHKVWLAGLGASVAGAGLQAWALSVGSLAVVEPVTTTTVLFALPLAAAWQRQRVRAHEWLGAVMLTGGIAVLLGVGAPTPGRVEMPGWQWAVAVGAAWALAFGLIRGSRRLASPAFCTAAVAGAAGVLFGLQDALSHSVFTQLGNGGTGVLLTWQPYVLAVTAVYGLTLAQSAYETGTFSASLPPMLVAEPVIGMCIGVFALGERLNNSTGAMALEVIGAVVMIAGTWLLARSPTVTGEHRRRLLRRASGPASASALRPRARAGSAVRR